MGMDLAEVGQLAPLGVLDLHGLAGLSHWRIRGKLASVRRSSVSRELRPSCSDQPSHIPTARYTPLVSPLPRSLTSPQSE